MVFKGVSSDPESFKKFSAEQIRANPSLDIEILYGTSVEAVTQRNRFIDQRVARNRNGLTRGRKRHKKHRRALAIRKLFQMASPPVFFSWKGQPISFDPFNLSDLTAASEDDFAKLVFAPSGAGKSFLVSSEELEAHVERFGRTGKGKSAWLRGNNEHTMTIGTTAEGMSAPKTSINIWDDYYDDGYVPEGEIQKTYIYIEGGELPAESHKECLEFLLAQILACHNLGEASFRMGLYRSRDLYPDLDEVYQFERWEIKVENLTHKSREMLVDELEEKNLAFNGLLLSIYSES